MRKILVIILAVCICLSMMFATVSANEENTEYIYTNGNLEVHIEKGTMSDKQIQRVLNQILGIEDDTPETEGLMCTLFGHSNSLTQTYTISHRVAATAPRCLRTTYNVYKCDRCDNIDTKLVSEIYIYCCS